jgi:hypothetical protein
VQLGVLECKVYHNVLMNTKSQVDFDLFLQEDNDISWGYGKVVNYCKEIGDDHCSNEK